MFSRSSTVFSLVMKFWQKQHKGDNLSFWLTVPGSGPSQSGAHWTSVVKNVAENDRSCSFRTAQAMIPATRPSNSTNPISITTTGPRHTLQVILDLKLTLGIHYHIYVIKNNNFLKVGIL